MAMLIDTSVLGRLANRADLAYPVATAAIAELHRRGEGLHVTPQNLVEFRNFATRRRWRALPDRQHSGQPLVAVWTQEQAFPRAG